MVFLLYEVSNLEHRVYRNRSDKCITGAVKYIRLQWAQQIIYEGRHINIHKELEGEGGIP